MPHLKRVELGLEEVPKTEGSQTKDYVVTFDVEVYPNKNQYRTHKITNIDLTESGAIPAPEAGATDSTLSLSKDITTQGRGIVKA